MCDDGDACTEDQCELDGGCRHRAWTLDADGDGHRSIRPGFTAGSVGACGDDCDDRNPLVFPGNAERCDGVDNDCDDSVDTGVVHVASTRPPVRVSSRQDERAMRGGFSATDTAFALTYSSYQARYRSWLEVLEVDGSSRSDALVSGVNADTFAGSLAWSGSELATVWEDARQAGNYEIYMARFSAEGVKLAPELRISDAGGFSLRPVIAWNRSEYLLVWDDRRSEEERAGDGARIYAQRVDRDGALLGRNVLLTPDATVAEGPAIALGGRRIGLVFTSTADSARLTFRVFEADFAAAGLEPPSMGQDVQSPSVHWVRDRFLLFWETYGNGPGSSLWGAAFSADAELLVAPQSITSGARFARTHAALSLGDRVLVVWADDRDGNYELYSQVFSPQLAPLTRPQRLSFDPADTLSPALAVGPNGDIGVLFDDWRSGSRQVYFTRLQCP